MLPYRKIRIITFSSVINIPIDFYFVMVLLQIKELFEYGKAKRHFFYSC